MNNWHKFQLFGLTYRKQRKIATINHWLIVVQKALSGFYYGKAYGIIGGGRGREGAYQSERILR